MAFNAQFFQLNPQSSLADDISSGYKAGYEMREGERKKKLQELFSSNLSATGDFNSQNFLEQAAKSNLGMEGIKEWLGQKTAKSDTAAKEATNAAILEGLGRTPDILRDWFEQEKTKRSSTIPTRVSEQGAGYTSASDNMAPVDVESLRDPSSIGTSAIKEDTKPTQKVQIPYPEGFHRPSDAPVDEGKSIDLGQGFITGKADDIETFKTPDPGLYTEQIPTEVPEKKGYDVVEEALRKKEGYSLINPTGTGSSTQQTDESIFSTPIFDDGSNEYRKYKSALDSTLKGMGFDSQEKWLKSIYDYTLQQNTPTQPNPLAFTGKDGAKEYGSEMMKYIQGQIQAKGKAEEAVLKAKESIISKAKEYGVQTVDQRKLELPQNMILRDSSKRAEAASLITNRVNIGNAKAAIDEAGDNTTALSLAAPQVIRAYATALNPAAQISEGNLIEVSKALYPEMSSKPEFFVKMATAMFRGLKGDWTGFKQLNDYANAGAPQAVKARMTKLAEEAVILNERNLANYVIKVPKEDKKTEDKTTPAPKKTSAADVVGGSPKAKTGGKKVETAAEKYARLKGKK